MGNISKYTNNKVGQPTNVLWFPFMLYVCVFPFQFWCVSFLSFVCVLTHSYILLVINNLLPNGYGNGIITQRIWCFLFPFILQCPWVRGNNCLVILQAQTFKTWTMITNPKMKTVEMRKYNSSMQAHKVLAHKYMVCGRVHKYSKIVAHPEQFGNMT